MDCVAIEGDLFPFHFGTLPDGQRAELEAHLSSCDKCLAAYFQTKRAIERVGEKETPRPSAMLRARLRRDVAAEFAPKRGRRVWAALSASAAVAAIVLLMLHGRAPIVPSSPTPEEVTHQESVNLGAQPVDSARDVNARLAFF